MTRTISQKMGIRSGMRTHLEMAPEGLLHHIAAPDLEVDSRLTGEFDYLHLFVRSQQEMESSFSKLKLHLAQGGALWVSWPKARPLGTGLNLHEVIRIGYARGLVESTCLSIDDTWSALRFSHPKPGKTYNNSHAVLVRDT